MQVLWIVSCFAHEQPDPDVWQSMAAAADVWAASAHVDIDRDQPFMRIATVPSESARDGLIARLRSVPGAVLHTGPSTRLDDQDFARADYVGVFADQERLVVTNASAAIRPLGPCPVCGLQDSYDAEQIAPLRLASDRVAGESSALPGGGLAVSGRIRGVLDSIGASGWQTRDLVDGLTGLPSRRWFQLLSDRTILAPCPTHTEVLGEPFCPHCGRAMGDVAGHFWIAPRTAAGDVLSRHPNGHTLLYFSRRLLDALAAANVRDLGFGEVMQICQHEK